MRRTPVTWTNDYIRIPFQEHGRTRDGADCWGLTCIIFLEQKGIVLPPLNGEYEDTKDRARISQLIASERISWDFIEKGQERAFDLAVFRMMGQPTHVAVVVEPGLMIHCERGGGVYLTEYYKEMQWDKRLEGFFRYADRPGIAAALPSS